MQTWGACEKGEGLVKKGRSLRGRGVPVRKRRELCGGGIEQNTQLYNETLFDASKSTKGCHSSNRTCSVAVRKRRRLGEGRLKRRSLEKKEEPVRKWSSL